MRASAHEELEGVIGELLALPPEEFTEARNAAVKRLRAAGRRDTADEVKGLPRPPVALWALNQLAREQPALVETFLAAAAELREAYRSGGDIRAASAPERAAETRVAKAVAELARARGKNVTDAVVQSLGQILHAAAADADTAGALRKGLLIREPAAPSIDQLLGSLPPVRAGKPVQHDTAEAPPKRDLAAERSALREQIATAKLAAKAARDQARAAADAERAARAEWEQAQTLAAAAKERSEAAAEALAELERQMEEL